MTRSTGWALLWVAGLVVLPVVAFQLGVERFHRANCSAPGFDGECDLGVLEGLVWAVATVLAYCALTLVVAWLRRRRTSVA